jgi:hypothetical protein
MNLNLLAGIILLLHLTPANKELDTSSHENFISVLGLKVDSRGYKDFRQHWDIDKHYESHERGIKLFVNSYTGKVDGILIAGENYDLDGIKFQKFSSDLPFGISWQDDTAALFRKLCDGRKMIGKDALKFYQGEISVEAMFNDLRRGKVLALKFGGEAKPAPKVVTVEEKKETAMDVRLKESLKEFETMPVKRKVREPNYYDSLYINESPFKQAILDVFKSYHESSFSSVKEDPLSQRNFWNYKYTYGTTIRIPGEKFNMLYSFPFLYSQLDFVSVIKESDSFDRSMEIAYKQFEKQLLENFSEDDGWVSVCLPNKESKKVSDLEFRNDKYGAIILDYSRNPNGRHVLYLRFLLFSS